MKILITGKNSYIGTSFEKWIAQYGAQYVVHTIDVVGDSWKKQSFSGYDTVLHVAGIAHIKETTKNTQLYYKVNRDLAVNLAIKAKQDGVKQFVFLSSMSVYGIDQGVIKEDTPCSPKSSYAKSKFEAEILLRELENNIFKVVIVRPPMVYGRGCKGNYPRLAKLALKLPIFPYVENERSMIHIDNLSEFIKIVMEDCTSGIFCPQNREYVCTAEMVKIIGEVHGKRIKLIKVFNFILKLFKINVVTKVFGNLVYDKQISECTKSYHVWDLRESISITEEN